MSQSSPPGVVTRQINGIAYHCKRLPAEPGLALFLKVSETLSSAQGLFEAIAANSEDPEMIGRFFDFARQMDAAKVHALIVELAAIPTRADGGKSEPEDMQGLLELAFFALATNFASFLPAGLGVMWTTPEAEGAVQA